MPKDKLGTFDDSWITQLKYCDTRAMLDYHREGFTLWGRHGSVLKYDTSRVAKDLESFGEKLNTAFGSGRSLIDGGLLNDKHAAIKDMFVVWDVLVAGDEHLLGTTYIDRYERLQGLATAEPFILKGYDIGFFISPSIFMPRNYLANDREKLWQLINEINTGYNSPLLEGLVLKLKSGRLEHGLRQANNSRWMIRSRLETGRHLF